MLEKVSSDVASTLTQGHHAESIDSQRVASEDTSHYILIKGLDKNKQQDVVMDMLKQQLTHREEQKKAQKKGSKQNDAKVEKASSKDTGDIKDSLLIEDDGTEVDVSNDVNTKPGSSGESKATLASAMQAEMSKFIAKHKDKIQPVTLSDNSSDDEKEARRTPKDIHGRYKKSSKKSAVTKPADDDVIYVNETKPKGPPVIDLSDDKYSAEGGFIRDEDVIVIDEVKPIIDSDSLQKQINDFLKKNAQKKRKESNSKSTDTKMDVDHQSQSSKLSSQNSNEDGEDSNKVNGTTVISDDEEDEATKMQTALKKLRQNRKSMLTMNDSKMSQVHKNSKPVVKVESDVDSKEDIKPIKVKLEKDDMDKFAKALNNQPSSGKAANNKHISKKIKKEKPDKQKNSGLDDLMTADYLESEPGQTNGGDHVKVKTEKPDPPNLGLTADFLESEPSHTSTKKDSKQQPKATPESDSDGKIYTL